MHDFARKRAPARKTDSHRYVVAAGIALTMSMLTLLAAPAAAQGALAAEIDTRAAAVENKVIAWRRDIHQNPELGNREHRTAKLVADELRRLGLEVKTEVAHTGVVALLQGGKPGQVVALRADMDALPITELTDLPFASKVKGVFEGKEVGVMHACGHDAHTAILLGVAEVLSALKDQLPGSVKFIFQPAEESPPKGEEGGAQLMIKQGALENPKPDAIFGLHVAANRNVGQIAYRSGPAMASVDTFTIKVDGKGTHGAAPWAGVDPIVVAAQIVLGLQTIESRQVNVTKEPSVITVGSIHGGNRPNIIPDSVEMVGTIRTFDEEMKKEIHDRIRNTAELIAKSAGASAAVAIEPLYGVTVNDPKTTGWIGASLQRSAGAQNVVEAPKVTGAEDFSYYQQRVPGVFFFVGITPKGTNPAQAAPNHSPRFIIDEAGLLLGVRALANVAVDFLQSQPN
jgi:amidohydrolase